MTFRSSRVGLLVAVLAAASACSMQAPRVNCSRHLQPINPAPPPVQNTPNGPAPQPPKDVPDEPQDTPR